MAMLITRGNKLLGGKRRKCKERGSSIMAHLVIGARKYVIVRYVIMQMDIGFVLSIGEAVM